MLYSRQSTFYKKHRMVHLKSEKELFFENYSTKWTFLVSYQFDFFKKSFVIVGS